MSSSLIHWIADKLKRGYSPLSIEEFLEERGYNRLHIQEVMKEIVEKGNRNLQENKQEDEFREKVIAKKLFHLSLPSPDTIKHIIVSLAIIAFIASLILMYIGRERIARVLISLIPLIFSLVLSCKLLIFKTPFLKKERGDSKLRNRLFEIVSIVSVSVFILSIFFPFLLLLILVGIVMSVYLVTKELRTGWMRSIKVNVALVIIGAVLYYGITVILGVVTGIFRVFM